MSRRGLKISSHSLRSLGGKVSYSVEWNPCHFWKPASQHHRRRGRSDIYRFPPALPHWSRELSQRELGRCYVDTHPLQHSSSLQLSPRRIGEYTPLWVKGLDTWLVRHILAVVSLSIVTLIRWKPLSQKNLRYVESLVINIIGDYKIYIILSLFDLASGTMFDFKASYHWKLTFLSMIWSYKHASNPCYHWF